MLRFNISCTLGSLNINASTVINHASILTDNRLAILLDTQNGGERCQPRARSKRGPIKWPANESDAGSSINQRKIYFEIYFDSLRDSNLTHESVILAAYKKSR